MACRKRLLRQQLSRRSSRSKDRNLHPISPSPKLPDYPTRLLQPVHKRKVASPLFGCSCTSLARCERRLCSGFQSCLCTSGRTGEHPFFSTPAIRISRSRRRSFLNRVSFASRTLQALCHRIPHFKRERVLLLYLLSLSCFFLEAFATPSPSNRPNPPIPVSGV
jgi:hypothetical protein